MKVWLYYLSPPYMYKCIPRLHAYTFSKDLAEGFEESRNMKLFKKRVVKIPKEEKIEIERKFSERRLILGSFKTFDGETLTGKLKKKYVKLICTVEEEESVALEECDFEMRLASHLSDPKFLNSEYIKALHKIGYIDLFCFHKNVCYEDPFYNNYAEELLGEKMKKGLEIDLFKLFLKGRPEMFTLKNLPNNTKKL